MRGWHLEPEHEGSLCWPRAPLSGCLQPRSQEEVGNSVISGIEHSPSPSIMALLEGHGWKFHEEDWASTPWKGISRASPPGEKVVKEDMTMNPPSFSHKPPTEHGQAQLASLWFSELSLHTLPVRHDERSQYLPVPCPPSYSLPLSMLPFFLFY